MKKSKHGTDAHSDHKFKMALKRDRPLLVGFTPSPQTSTVRVKRKLGEAPFGVRKYGWDRTSPPHLKVKEA